MKIPTKFSNSSAILHHSDLIITKKRITNDVCVEMGISNRVSVRSIYLVDYGFVKLQKVMVDSRFESFEEAQIWCDIRDFNVLNRKDFNKKHIHKMFEFNRESDPCNLFGIMLNSIYGTIGNSKSNPRMKAFFNKT